MMDGRSSVRIVLGVLHFFDRVVPTFDSYELTIERSCDAYLSGQAGCAYFIRKNNMSGDARVAAMMGFCDCSSAEEQPSWWMKSCEEFKWVPDDYCSTKFPSMSASKVTVSARGTPG
jgi:hypothetical protein